MKKVILKIDGMSCSACQNKIEKYLNKQDGVKASVNLIMAQALINYDEEKVNINDLERFIKESGYKSLGIYNEKFENKKDNRKFLLIIYAILIIILMYISMAHMLNIPTISFLDKHTKPINYGLSLLIITIPFIIYGFDIIKSGLKKIFKGPNMDTLVTIGVLASFIYSLFNLIAIIINKNANYNLYFESCAMIIYFIKLGRFIDQNAKEKSREAIKELVQITPKMALIKIDDDEKEVTIDEVKKGDILICKVGQKIATDGIITYGESHFDESFITGESRPLKKKVKDKVVAGSINLDGYIEYKALKIGPESTISEIVRLVMEAINTKAPIGRLADKVSSYFVPGIMIISIITFLINLILGKSFNNSVISLVTVLVVACPCALGLATPLCMVVSTSTSAKKGILIKSSEILEITKDIDTIVFDKTGTLTYGNLKISKIYNYSNESNDTLLKIIASLENNSNHPIAKAFREYYDSKVKVNKFKNIEGSGIYGEIDNKKIYIGNNKILSNLKIKNLYLKEEAELTKNGNSIVYVIMDNVIIGLIGVKDIIRVNAKETINKLKSLNKEIIILSGDNQNTANIIAKELGIDKVIANLYPKEKEEYLKNLKTAKRVMMVGDGINDAPSLAISDVGVSINGGTDIAMDSADVILMHDNLEDLYTLFKISEKTIKIIKQNLFWAFIYNILMIPIAMGLFKSFNITISPVLASIMMVFSSLSVVFNSLRLRKMNK